MTTMSIRTFLSTSQKLPSSVSIMLRGVHGIGKSKLIRQLALKVGLKQEDVIDRRLSQMTEGDIIGLPSTDGNTTRFNPPSWYHEACQHPKMLFLDELNRATPEVMQAAFQIVLDRELNGFKLHPQTRVATAVNASAAYNVNEIDPALLDRFWCIDLQPDTQDWLDWARNDDPQFGGRVHPTVVDFIASTDKFLDPPKNAEPGTVHPSRRSWERLAQALVYANVADAPVDPLFYSMCLGFVGTEATIAFHDFAKSVDNRIEAKDVINHYSKVRARVKAASPDRQNTIIDKVADYVLKEVGALSDKQGPNLRDFFNDLPPELRVSAWSKLTAQGVDRLEVAKSVHQWCAESIVTGVFGVPMGEQGIGCVPNIPSIFKQDGKDKK